MFQIRSAKVLDSMFGYLWTLEADIIGAGILTSYVQYIYKYVHTIPENTSRAKKANTHICTNMYMHIYIHMYMEV